MLAVKCPVCLVTRELLPGEEGGKVSCRVCGQKMKVVAPPPQTLPAAGNRTVLVPPEPDGLPPDAHHSHAGDPPPVRRAGPSEAPSEADPGDRGQSDRRCRPDPSGRDRNPPRADWDEDERDDDRDGDRGRGRRSYRRHSRRALDYCRRCDLDVRPEFASRAAQPWSLVCIIFGALLAWTVLGIGLIVLGCLLKQRVEVCPECGEVLWVGGAGFS